MDNGRLVSARIHTLDKRIRGLVAQLQECVLNDIQRGMFVTRQALRIANQSSLVLLEDRENPLPLTGVHAVAGHPPLRCDDASIGRRHYDGIPGASFQEIGIIPR